MELHRTKNRNLSNKFFDGGEDDYLEQALADNGFGKTDVEIRREMYESSQGAAPSNVSSEVSQPDTGAKQIDFYKGGRPAGVETGWQGPTPDDYKKATGLTLTAKGGEGEITITGTNNSGDYVSEDGRIISKESVDKAVRNNPEAQQTLERLSTSSTEQGGTKSSEDVNNGSHVPGQTPGSEEQPKLSSDGKVYLPQKATKGENAETIGQDAINEAAKGDHTIAKGDTLWKYSNQQSQEKGALMSVTTLALFNGIDDPNMIIAGDTIDFDIDQDEITAVQKDITDFLTSFESTTAEFTRGATAYGAGLDIQNGSSIKSMIETIEEENKKNEETIIADANNYNAWLGRVVESLEADKQETYGTWGNTELLDINEI